MTTNEELIIFCRNIKYLRNKFGFSKAKMAKILGIGIKGLTMMENEVFPPRTGVECLGRFCTFFGVRPGCAFRPLWDETEKAAELPENQPASLDLPAIM